MSLHSPLRAAAVLLVTLAACAASSPSSGSYDAAVDVHVDVPPDAPEIRDARVWGAALCERLFTRPERALCQQVPMTGDWCSTEGDADAGLLTWQACLDRYLPIQLRLPQPVRSRVGPWVLQCPGTPSRCWEACGADRRLYLGEVVQRAIAFAWETGTCWPTD